MDLMLKPHLEVLPPPQMRLWDELHATPKEFTLYGGTALALHLGHRQSVDFDFFSSREFTPQELLQSVPYLKGAVPIDMGRNTLTCSIDRDGLVKMQFFGGLKLESVQPRLEAACNQIWIASLVDVAGSKFKVLPERSETKDYLDMDALLKHGIDVPTMIAAAKIIYGPDFNAAPSLKAMSYFDDIKGLAVDQKERLTKASIDVDLEALPDLRQQECSRYGGRER